MRPFLEKTFGALSGSYYSRQFFLGLLFLAMTVFAGSRSQQGVPFAIIMLAGVNTVLYPYARLVYESVVAFFLGGNVFCVNPFIMTVVKSLTMTLCWAFAIFIAPLGLLYLYYHHRKAAE